VCFTSRRQEIPGVPAGIPARLGKGISKMVAQPLSTGEGGFMISEEPL